MPQEINFEPYTQYMLQECEKVRLPGTDLVNLMLGSYGGTSRHHNYVGGLLVHTCEVLRIVQCYKSYNSLFRAAILHDIAKSKEYDATGGKTAYYYNVGHVCGSILMALEMGIEFNEAEIHMMLAHHYKQEWKSPVSPQTPDALLLHMADMCSAQHGRITPTSDVTCPILRFENV